jgi:hypothetical protein
MPNDLMRPYRMIIRADNEDAVDDAYTVCAPRSQSPPHECDGIPTCGDDHVRSKCHVDEQNFVHARIHTARCHGMGADDTERDRRAEAGYHVSFADGFECLEICRR